MLPAHMLPQPFGSGGWAGAGTPRTRPLATAPIFLPSDGASSASELSARRVLYRPPELRVARRLKPSDGANLSPESVAAARQPKLVRGWMHPASSPGLAGALAPLLEWGAESKLRAAFEGWALVRVKAQVRTGAKHFRHYVWPIYILLLIESATPCC
jgi:hypothetical protein